MTSKERLDEIATTNAYVGDREVSQLARELLDERAELVDKNRALSRVMQERSAAERERDDLARRLAVVEGELAKVAAMHVEWRKHLAKAPCNPARTNCTEEDPCPVHAPLSYSEQHPATPPAPRTDPLAVAAARLCHELTCDPAQNALNDGTTDAWTALSALVTGVAWTALSALVTGVEAAPPEEPVITDAMACDAHPVDNAILQPLGGPPPAPTEVWMERTPSGWDLREPGAFLSGYESAGPYVLATVTASDKKRARAWLKANHFNTFSAGVLHALRTSLTAFVATIRTERDAAHRAEVKAARASLDAQHQDALRALHDQIDSLETSLSQATSEGAEWHSRYKQATEQVEAARAEAYERAVSDAQATIRHVRDSREHAGSRRTIQLSRDVAAVFLDAEEVLYVIRALKGAAK